MNGQPEQVQPTGKSRRLKIVVFTLVGLIALYFVYRHSLSVTIQTRLDAIRRAGYPATCAELDKWYPQPPAGQNAADIYGEAFAHYNAWTNSDVDRAKLKLLPIEGSAKSPPRTAPLPSEMKLLVSRYLSDNTEPLRLIHQASTTDSCRFPVDLSQGEAVQLPHLRGLRRAARLLELEALEDLEEQEPQKAAESVIASLGVARSLDHEPVLISYLVRVACQSVALDSLEHVLNRMPLTDDQLTKLVPAIATAENHEVLTRAFAGERCMGVDIFDEIRTGKLSPGQVFGGSFWIRPFFRLFKMVGLLESDEESYHDVMGRYMAATQLSPPECLEAYRSVNNSVANLPRLRIMTHFLLGSLSRTMILEARLDAKLRDAQTALAIQRYRLANGRLPDQLSDLVPKFLPAVLTDPFDGKPLRYKKLAKGYIVYSVGEDTVDNGGTEKNSKGLSYGEGTDITFTVER